MNNNYINTLYYTFSAIPQVIGTIAALLATFTVFRVKHLREYLIGDGKAVLNRWGNIGYRFPNILEDKKQKNRLRDAIDRKSIPEIKNIISQLRNIEEIEGYSKADRPHGLQYVYDIFNETEKHIDLLNLKIRNVVIFSFITIIVSISSLALTHAIYSDRCPGYQIIVLGLNFSLFLISLVLALRLVLLGLSKNTVHEIDRKAF